MHAAIVGSLWASAEIVAGSFMHNLRFPFAGIILSMAGVTLMVAYHRLWPVSWLFVKAGLVCALMKTLSPSGVILGPVIGIMLESLALQMAVFLLGRNWFGYSLGGILAVLTVPVYMIGSYYIKFGFAFFVLLQQMAASFVPDSMISGDGLLRLILGLTLFFGFLGAMSSWIGLYIGLKFRFGANMETVYNEPASAFVPSIFTRISRPWLIVVYVFCIAGGILFQKGGNFYFASGLIVLYTAILIYFYKNLFGIFYKIHFWVQLLVLTALATMFMERFTWFSLQGLKAGLEMNFRAILIVSSFVAISTEIKSMMLAKFLLKKQVHGFYQAAAIAFEILPKVISHYSGSVRKIYNPLNFMRIILQQAEVLHSQYAVSKPHVFIVSGDLHTGKSTFVRSLHAELKPSFSTKGFYSLAVFNDSRRQGYDVEVFPNAARKQLCRDFQFQQGFSYMKYFFSEETVNYVEGSMLIGPLPDIYILDEIGLIETDFKLGWDNLLRKVLKLPVKAIVIVVRKQFVDKVINNYNLENYSEFSVLVYSPETAAKGIKDKIANRESEKG